jgi:predicted site-specific integrase-resolvase
MGENENAPMTCSKHGNGANPHGKAISMLAPITVPARAQFCRVQTAARLLGVSVQTIRNYADDPINRIEVRRSPGGHRYIDLSAIAEVFGFDLGDGEPVGSEEVAQGKISVRYSRVSTRSQCVDKNLERQAARLREYVEAHHPGETCLQVSEQASGINSERKGLTKIIDLALAGRLKTLFIETEDRLSRGSYALIARLLNRCGVEIVVTRTGERESTAKSAEEEIFADAMAMIYVGQSRLYGKRANLAKRFVPSQSLRDRIVQLYSQGIPAGRIFETIRGENHRCQNTGRALTVKAVWTVIKHIERATPGKHVPESVRRFVKEACTVGPSQTVLTRDLWAAFNQFCEARGLPRVSKHKLPAFIRAAVPTARTYKASHHGDGLEVSGLTLQANAP